MGLLGGSIRKGGWWLRSSSSPKWSCDGRGYVGGMVVPHDAQVAIDEMKKEFGEEPPDDLEFGYMKD